jgi:hypothetical protein
LEIDVARQAIWQNTVVENHTLAIADVHHLHMVEGIMDITVVDPDHLYTTKEAIDLHQTTTVEGDPEPHRDMDDHLALTITAEGDREAHEAMVALDLLLMLVENRYAQEAHMEEAGIILQMTDHHCQMT